MKIAIKNNKNLHDGVILIECLTNLNGKNINDLSGYSSTGRYYYINEENIINAKHIADFHDSKNYKFYESVDEYLDNLQIMLKNRSSPKRIINYTDI
jgi:hypothetical protein